MREFIWILINLRTIFASFILITGSQAGFTQQPGTKKWEFTAGGNVISSPAIGQNGTIYIGSKDGKLYAINPNGLKRWEFATGGVIDSAPSVGPDGSIYVYSQDRNLYALNPDGTKRWQFSAKVSGISSPAIGSDGTIYFTADDGLRAINPNGSVKWTFSTGALMVPPVIGADGTIYTPSKGYVYALNPDGSEKWKFRLAPSYVVQTSMVIGGDGVLQVIASFDLGGAPGYPPDNLHYLLNPDGTKKRQSDTSETVPAVVGKDQTTYVGLGDTVRAKFSTGELKWEFRTESEVTTSAALADDGTVYVGTLKGVLFAITFAGQERWRFETSTPIYSWPTIGNEGVVYFGSGNKLYAVNGASGLANGAPWPMYAHDPRHTAAVPVPTPAGVSIRMYAGLAVSGEIGKTYRIDFARDVDANQWQPLSTITLDRSPYLFIDIESTNSTKKFYRAILVP